ncbi:F-box protein [Quillaja saponaria]|uniref:F-box protein n=1 Tax=Quillaja saponaria TaxID=32244 RepID=A0AAD7KNH5_QUISA|nr:F-box protein [Quillaja saponaria]
MASQRKIRHRRKKSKEQRYAEWSSLPRCILEMISERLPIIDCVSISNVCKSWRCVLGEELPGWKKRGFPWLLMSGQNQREIRTYVSIIENRVWEMKLPEANGKYFWGSFQDWLIMVQDQGLFSLDVNLLNPFSGGKISLPGIWNFYHKIVLSGLPSENNFICMLLHNRYRELAFWVSGSQSWHKHKLVGHPFEDAVFCNGSFYLLSDGCNIWQIDASSIFSAINEVDTLFGNFSNIETKFHEVKMPERSQLDVIVVSERHRDDRILSYLLESSGQVLLVCRYYSNKPDAVLETRRFEVYTLDLCEFSWKKVESLGDQVLFLGKCSSMLLPAKELGVGMNNIYFSNDPVTPWWNEWDSCHLKGVSARLGLDKSDWKDWGVFRLGNEGSETFCFHGNRDNWAPTWLTAPLWWCCRNISST